MVGPAHRFEFDESGVPGSDRLQAAIGSLDRTDLSILVQLLRDARRSLRRIAREVGMSAPAVGERIARLERLGIVRGYRAEVDWGRLGYGLVVYVRVFSVQGSEQTLAVEALREVPEVEQVEAVTGDSDLLIRLRATDQHHLRRCLFEKIWKVPGVHRTETLICLTELPPKAFDLELAESLLSATEADRSHLGTHDAA
jgi:DNA-binding Lrp family transcriptional regulator